MNGGDLDNQGTITGGVGGNILNINVPIADNQFAGAGGLGASLTGGSHTNSGTIQGRSAASAIMSRVRVTASAAVASHLPAAHLSSTAAISSERTVAPVEAAAVAAAVPAALA